MPQFVVDVLENTDDLISDLAMPHRLSGSVLIDVQQRPFRFRSLLSSIACPNPAPSDRPPRESPFRDRHLIADRSHCIPPLPESVPIRVHPCPFPFIHARSSSAAQQFTHRSFVSPPRRPVSTPKRRLSKSPGE